VKTAFIQMLLGMIIFNFVPLASSENQESISNNEKWKEKIKQWSELPKGPKIAPAGLVWIYGWSGGRFGNQLTQGAGVHSKSGWVLADQSVIDGLPLVTVSSIRKYKQGQIDFLVTSIYSSSSKNFVWLEVPGLQGHPTASIHSTPFGAGDYLFGYLEDFRDSVRVYKTSSDSSFPKIERATSVPFAYSLAASDHGPDSIGAYPLFDDNGLWAGFLTKEEPARGLNRRLFEAPNEESYLSSALLLDKAPNQPARMMPGFPFSSFSKVLSGWNVSMEARKKIAAYCARNPTDPWGWFALGFAQTYSGRSVDGLAALHRAAEILPDSSLIAWMLADVLANSLDFEQAELFYERALKIDPSICRWSNKAKQIGKVYHVLGLHDKESSIQFGSPKTPQEISPDEALTYGEWLISHNRHAEAKNFLQNAWERSQSTKSSSWIAHLALEHLLESLGKLDQATDSFQLFQDYGSQLDALERIAFVEFWTRHGMAESKIELFKEWLKNPPEKGDWLYSLSPSVIEKFLETNRSQIRTAFETSASMIHFLYYKLGSCKDVLLEAKREEKISDDPEQVAIRVRCLHKMGRMEEAVQILLKASDREDDSIEHWAGDLWFELDDYKRAKDAYLRVIADGDNYWKRWEGLGRTYEVLGEKKNAINAYSKALKQNRNSLESLFSNSGGSSDPFPISLMNKLVEFGKKHEVLKFCQYSLQLGFGLQSMDKAAQNQLFELFNKTGVPAFADSILQNSLSANPGDSNSWFLLGKNYLKKGDSLKAEICLRRLNDLNSELAAALATEIKSRSQN
jgi:tetratricopeptide (TPR) repeat protein